jgi:uncharacterized protein YndB with AHSA1/START domain
MAGSSFIYVTYIRTTPEALWRALTTPEFMAQYWLGAWGEAEWRVGGSWRLVFKDGRVADEGEILEFDPPSRLAIKWRNAWSPEFREEGWSHCLMELEPKDETVKLTVTHTMERENAKFIGAVGNGWPQILSNLKSLLLTGVVILKPMG